MFSNKGEGHYGILKKSCPLKELYKSFEFRTVFLGQHSVLSCNDSCIYSLSLPRKSISGFK